MAVWQCGSLEVWKLGGLEEPQRLRPGPPPLAAMRPNAARLLPCRPKGPNLPRLRTQRTTKGHKGRRRRGTADFADLLQIKGVLAHADCQNNWKSQRTQRTQRRRWGRAVRARKAHVQPGGLLGRGGLRTPRFGFGSPPPRTTLSPVAPAGRPSKSLCLAELAAVLYVRCVLPRRPSGTSQTCRGCRENFSLPGVGQFPTPSNQPINQKPLCP